MLNIGDVTTLPLTKILIGEKKVRMAGRRNPLVGGWLILRHMSHGSIHDAVLTRSRGEHLRVETSE
jgi:hypothetical protein